MKIPDGLTNPRRCVDHLAKDEQLTPAIEILQGVLGLGASDIDDVILNTAGGLIGILIIGLLARLGRDRMRTILAVLAMLSIPVLAGCCSRCAC